MQNNKRKYTRFSATAFLNMPVSLSPVEPFFGETLTGRLIDLSAGGMALAIPEMIPMDTSLRLAMTFPDQSRLDSIVQVRHCSPRNGEYLHGFEFIQLPTYWGEKITRMSSDYIDCENRISAGKKEVCELDCSFYNMCKKPQRKVPVVDVDYALQLAFNTLEKKTSA